MSDEARDDSSDYELGPQPAGASEEPKAGEPCAGGGEPQRKRRKKQVPLANEAVFVEALPSASLYERSYMHRDIVTHVAVARQSEFIITGSIDGHVKFWRKMPTGIEFVKHFQAHLGPLHAMSVSPDGRRLVTTSQDKFIKFFDVQTFDMSSMMNVEFVPTVCVWIAGFAGVYDRIAVADSDSGLIHAYSTHSWQLLGQVTLHESPVQCMCFDAKRGLGMSCDKRGLLEFWDCETLQAPETDKVQFRFKSETDLYELAKSRTTAAALAVSPTGDLLAVLTPSHLLLLFDVSTGKLRRKYDESAAAANAAGQDPAEAKRRAGLEEEVDAALAQGGPGTQSPSLQFDETGHFLLYGAPAGIKLLNVVSNRVACVLGSAEPSGERFLALGLYQGVPKVDAQYLLARNPAEGATKTADQMNAAGSQPDPTVYATAFNRRRFYCFSRREPGDAPAPSSSSSSSSSARDVLNEKPTAEERQSAAAPDPRAGLKHGREAVLRTSVGEVTIKLYGAECPRTVENFATHAKNGYFDGLVFHRVIKGFMLQTGDPRGDGTGGESIWGGEFEDEFHPSLRHSLPFTVSMANSGPNTNGSQFYITCAPCPHLDNKHTVFGRVTKGFDVISTIEQTKTNKHDRPLADIKILKVDILK